MRLFEHQAPGEFHVQYTVRSIYTGWARLADTKCPDPSTQVVKAPVSALSLDHALLLLKSTPNHYLALAGGRIGLRDAVPRSVSAFRSWGWLMHYV